jgi:glycine oxidase
MDIVIIVGAGIIGLSCARALARAGHSITVFDKGSAAREASWAGAGMLAPGGEFEMDSPLLRMAAQSLSLYPDFVHDLQAESGVSIDFRRCGALEVAMPGEEAELLRKAQLRARLGIQSEPAAHGEYVARFYPDDGLVDPRHVTAALLKACRSQGVVFREHEPVLRVALDGSSVETARGHFEDDGVLIAAGAWSGELYSGLPRTRPVRGHLISWEIPRGFLGPIVRNGGTYVMQRASGTVVAGSSTEEAGFDRALDESILADIARRAQALVPGLRGIPPRERWNGLRPAIEGEVPAIGRIAGTAVYTAFGHYRNGILLAPETARMIAELAS